MNSINIFREFDSKQLYRFFVDGRFYAIEHGWEEYEKREPGSIEGMSLAYAHMLDNFDISDGISLNYIRELHTFVVSKMEHKAKRNRYPGQIRQFQVSFLIKPRTCSLDGLYELLEEQGINDGIRDAKLKNYQDIETIYREILSDKNVRYCAFIGELPNLLKEAIIDIKPKELYFEGRKLVQMNIEKRALELINEFNSEIKSKGEDDKLYFIIDFIKKFVRLHPFVDANARVLINILLNHILMFHGFTPIIYEEPSIFDARTTDEIIVEIKLGQHIVKTIIENPTLKVFNHSIDDESDESHKKIIKLMEKFIKKLDNTKGYN